MPTRFVLIAFGLCFAWPAAAQTRIVADVEVGSQSGLGYKLPSTSFGVQIERPTGRRLELQAAATFSPDRKYITNDGDGVILGGAAIVWITPRVGALAHLRYSHLWTSEFDKTAWAPGVGGVVRDSWSGLAGRLQAEYVLPTGCVWATASNPCMIQSSRLQGVDALQEFRIYRGVRFGIRGGAWHFCQQGNPQDPAAGRKCQSTGTVAVVLRFEWPRVPETQIY
jgi:hypothetical protein